MVNHLSPFPIPDLIEYRRQLLYNQEWSSPYRIKLATLPDCRSRVSQVHQIALLIRRFTKTVSTGTSTELPPGRLVTQPKLENRICRQIQDLHASFWHQGEKELQRPFAKLHILVHSFYLKGLKLSFFSLYGQPFLRYRPIFKIGIFGHETWPLEKVPEVAHTLSFYPTGRNWAYFHSTASGFRDIDRFFFKIAIFEHKTWQLAKVPKFQIHPFSTQGVQNLAHFRSMGSGLRDINHFSKLPYLGMKFGHWQKFQKLYMYSLSNAGDRN